MALYEPTSPELGKNAIRRRVNALRAMNAAGGPQYRRYDREGAAPTYQVETEGKLRELATKDVPAYVIGQSDGYRGFRAQVMEALDSALANPDVSDRDSMMRAVLTTLDAKCGDPLAQAAAFFHSDTEPAAAVA